MIHTTEVAVRFVDLDAFNHVNNAHFLTYIEHGRMHFFDDVIGPVDWEHEGFIIARAEINYLQPIRLHDKIIVETGCPKIATKSFHLSYKIMKIEKDELGNERRTEMANALTVQVCYDYKNHRTIPVPSSWIQKLQQI